MKKNIIIATTILIAFYCEAQQSRQADSIQRRRTADSLRQLTEADHKQMMNQLHITTLRTGANGSNPNAPNAANWPVFIQFAVKYFDSNKNYY